MASIAVIGTGYVGLTTGVCFAHLGHDVVCADVVAEKVARLSRGEATILERGLEEMLREGLKEGRLRFVLGAAEAVAGAEFVYLCVPTPQAPDGSADMSYIDTVAREISSRLAPDTVVVNKSTVPVGSTRLVEQALGRADVSVVSNPEFLREGSAINDFLKPDRVVIGSDDQRAAIRVAALYIGVPAPLMVTDPASAETIKYASNAFLATKLSFVNAVAAVCEAVGADVNDVVLGMGYDRRIGGEFLRPGPGWGGSCLVGAETVLARRGLDVRLRRLDELAAAAVRTGLAGWEVAAWAPDEPTPAFFPLADLTVRSYQGEVIEVVTESGRRVTVTPDHPLVVSDGSPDRPPGLGLAAEVEASAAAGRDVWLPVAQGAPLGPDEPVATGAGAWPLTPAARRAELARLWDGGAGGPVERELASPRLADAVLRLLGELRVAATRTGERRVRLAGGGAGLATRLAAPGAGTRAWPGPETKGASWTRVVATRRRPHDGLVYSLEVPGPHTVVTTAGLVVHNCFPKDTRALLRIARDAGYDFDLLEGVLTVNEEQFERIAEKVVTLVGGSVEGHTVGVWGLTFKAGTDDLRESPALAVIERLVARGARVQAYDPAVRALPPGTDVEVVGDPYAACEQASVLVVLTEWDELKWLDLDKVAGLMAATRVVDARNLLDRSALVRRGFTYAAVGRS